MYDSTGIDPETKAYLKRIINSIFITLLWMMACAIAGLYFKLAIVDGKISIRNIIFYLLFVASFLLLLRYLLKLWKGHM